MLKYELSDLPKPIQKALGQERVFTQALFERPESLSHLLPYDEYIESSGHFRHKDGSLGALFEADLLEHEPLTADQIVSQVDGLKTWFTLPENCVLQVLFDQAPVSSLDPEFAAVADKNPGGHPVSQKLLASRLNAMRQACNRPGQSMPLRRRTLVSVRYFPEFARTGIARDLLKRGEVTLYKEMRAFLSEARAFEQILLSFEKNSKVRLKRLNAQQLLDTLRQFFNPKTSYKRSFAPYNPNVPLSDQIIYHAPTLDYPGITREGLKTRTLTLKTSPQFAYPGGMAYFLKLGFPFKLSLNFSFPTRQKAKAFFDLKEFFLQNTPSAKARRQREEVLAVQEQLARDDRCLHMTFSVILEGETDEVLEGRVREVVNVFHNDLECETIQEDDIGLGLCLNSLPLNYSPASDYSTKRAIRILRSDVTRFIPVFDSFRGLDDPLQLYLSRENNLVRFSLTGNETSNHTVVLADSGSGKSAFIIDCIQSIKRLTPDPLVFVIDKKSSYSMVAEYFEADVTVFKPGKKSPFSPFRGTVDEEKVAFLTSLVSTAVRLTNPSFAFDSTHTAAISKSIRIAYEKKGAQSRTGYHEGGFFERAIQADVDVTMDDVITELAGLTSEEKFEFAAVQTQELIQKLTPFYGDGIYADYFRSHLGKKTKDTPKSFYIYDLDPLDSDPVIQTLMTMAVIEEIRRVIRLPENQGRTGVIVLEELGMLGRDNPTASRFILDAAETFRKLGYWLIGLTPRPQNYFELEAGKAMWGVADNFIFLQMSADNVDYLKKHSGLIDEANGEIIQSLRTKRGSHADVYYLNKKKTRQGAFRYSQTPLDRWLAPTNAQDAALAIKALKRFPGEKWKALEFLASQSDVAQLPTESSSPALAWEDTV